MSKKISIVIIVLGVLTVLIPLVILPTCEGMLELVSGKTVPMKCHWMGIAQSMIGIIIIIAGFCSIFVKSKDARIAQGITGIACGIISLLIPTVFIGVCGNPAMACRIGTLPGLIIVGALTIAFSVLFVILTCASDKKQRASENNSE